MSDTGCPHQPVSSASDCFGGHKVDDGDATTGLVAFTMIGVVSSTSCRRRIDTGPV